MIIFRAGEARRIEHTVSSDDAFQVLAVAMDIFDAAGQPVVEAAAGQVDSEAAASEHRIWYTWEPGEALPGDYTYLLRYAVGEQSIAIRGELCLLEAVSVWDRWVRRVEQWLRESGAGEALQSVSYVEMREAAKGALTRYSKGNPRQLCVEQELTAGVWEYDLPAEWEAGYSQVQRVEYPVGESWPSRALALGRWRVDEARGKWHFRGIYHSSGQIARIYFTAPHAIREAVGEEAAVDTVPERDFAAVAQCAAGLALMTLANEAAGTSQPAIGAELVNYRTKEQEYGARARAMLEEAEGAWPHTASWSVGGEPF